jgi:Flp pilus assembly protein TadG
MVPLVALCLIGLLGFVALAIDIGLIALAKNRCQNIADLAAMAGARELNGDSLNNNNYTTAKSTAATAATTNNSILTRPVTASDVNIQVGSFSYDYTNKKFVIYPNSKPSTENWTLVQASVGVTNESTFFASLLRVPSFNTQATASAAHRPRDVVVIADLSGSMRFDSNLGMDHSGARSVSMNPETVYPEFGHYYSNDSWLLGSSTYAIGSGEVAGLCNVTVATSSGSALIEDFYQDTTRYGTTTKAFTPAPDSYATSPDGTKYLAKKNKTAPPDFAVTVADITGTTSYDSTWEDNGYGSSFKGYTTGPRYWGKTFFIWPPDPRYQTGARFDWRKRYFTYPGSSTRMDDNTRLWDSGGVWRAPGSNTYAIDYARILTWITSTGPNPFPTRLQAGGIIYYDAIPTSITAGSGNGPPTNQNERFWKEYIDYVLGVRDNYDGSYTAITEQTGYGRDRQWGSVQINDPPSTRYMDYKDNPLRPVTRMWFGPMTMIDFIGNYNQGRFWWPGTIHEASTFQLKLGIQAAMTDIKINHPNDNVGLIFFNTPDYSSGKQGNYNTAQVALGRDYTRLINSLWFAPQSIDDSARDIRPYDNDGAIHDVPRGKGGTCYAMPLYLAYNQFSSNRSNQLYTWDPNKPGLAGGNGRVGSQKLIIFETDGMVNTEAAATWTDAGKWTSFYNVRIGSTNEYPKSSGTGDSAAQAEAAATRICALETDAARGYSTPRKPVLIHTIAYGALFETSNTNANKQAALDRLQMLQYIGGKAGGEQPDPDTPLASYKRIVGPFQTRIDNMQKAFSAIMQDGVQVSLVE